MILKNKIELTSLVDSLHRENKKIITANGCFDILHPGHIANFSTAKALGDCLIVLINSDTNPYFQKKPGRPINDEEFRATMLDALKFVDYVYIFEEENPIETLKIIKPSIHVKGGDYNKENLPEYPIIQSWGGTVKIIPTLPEFSTTNVVHKIISTYTR